jgi:hypothetical protein
MGVIVFEQVVEVAAAGRAKGQSKREEHTLQCCSCRSDGGRPDHERDNTTTVNKHVPDLAACLPSVPDR